MKLILTLLALLTGFAGGDAVRQAPASPAAMATGLAIVEAVGEARSAQAAHRPMAQPPRRLVIRPADMVRAVTPAPVIAGLTPRGLRARE